MWIIKQLPLYLQHFMEKTRNKVEATWFSLIEVPITTNAFEQITYSLGTLVFFLQNVDNNKTTVIK